MGVDKEGFPIWESVICALETTIRCRKWESCAMRKEPKMDMSKLFTIVANADEQNSEGNVIQD